MCVSAQELPVARRWMQKLYLSVTGLILIGIVSEGLLIGPSLFADTTWGRRIHIILGGLLLLLMLLLPVLGRLSRLSSRITLLSVVPFVLALIEVPSGDLGRQVPFLAALHPATARNGKGRPFARKTVGEALCCAIHAHLLTTCGTVPLNSVIYTM